MTFDSASSFRALTAIGRGAEELNYRADSAALAGAEATVVRAAGDINSIVSSMLPIYAATDVTVHAEATNDLTTATVVVGSTRDPVGNPVVYNANLYALWQAIFNALPLEALRRIAADLGYDVREVRRACAQTLSLTIALRNTSAMNFAPTEEKLLESEAWMRANTRNGDGT